MFVPVEKRCKGTTIPLNVQTRKQKGPTRTTNISQKSCTFAGEMKNTHKITMKDIYYRPEWTCGKYNTTKHVAIMFNLLMNGEYFFEHESADVVGLILAAGRNGKVSVTKISQALNITPESIIPFFDSLLENGLLTEKCPLEKDVSEYKRHCAAQSNETSYMGENAEHYLHCDISSVQEAYDNAVADCTEINSVLFELTYRCSEKCLHCYNIGATRNDKEKSGRADFEELSLRDYKRIIDEMCEAGLVSASLSGGDPFSHKDVWDIMEYLYQKDIAVTILTNGQQVVNQINRLAKLYPKTVRVSLYAANPEMHDGITRKKGSWQISMDVVRNLKATGVPVGISCVLMRPGLKTYLELKSLSKQLSCPLSIDYGVVSSMDGDVCATNHMRLTPEEMELIMMDPDIEMKKDDFEMSANPAPAKKGVPCMAGQRTFCVMPDGKLIPCVSMHLVLGNLKMQDLHSIVTNNPKLHKILEATKSDYIECGTHDYCKCCTFCAGNSYAEHRTPFHANENDCYCAKNKYSLMMKLRDGIDILNGKSIQENLESIPKYVFSPMYREYK